MATDKLSVVSCVLQRRFARLGFNLLVGAFAHAQTARTAARTRRADPKPSGGAMTRDTRRHGSHGTLAQVHNNDEGMGKLLHVDSEARLNIRPLAFPL